MAIRVPIISDFQDKGVKKATAAFDKFKSDIAKADGAMNKFRAGTSSAFSAVQANALSFATVAGAAIVTFAAKAVISYKNLGLAVGKFADATGVSTEQASRLIEVTSDLNIESTSLQTALNKLNKAAASGAAGFQTIGAEIARTSTGAVDVQQTFFNVIDALNGIKDPAIRAKVATELLGKGWQDLAVIIEGGSQNLKKSLESVSDAKIYSAEQVEQTRRLEAAFKNLQDVGEDFAQSVGRALTPAVITAVEAITSMLNTMKDVRDFEIFGIKVGDIAGNLVKLHLAGFQGAQALYGFITAADEGTPITEAMMAAIAEGADAMTRARLESEVLSGEMSTLAISTDQVSASWDALKRSLQIGDVMSEANRRVDEFLQKWLGAMAAGQVSAEEFQGDLLGIKLYLMDIFDQVGVTASAFLRNQFRIFVDTSQIERAIALLNSISTGGELSYGFLESGSALMGGGAWVDGVYIPPGLDFSGFMADGGLVNGPTLAVIGEAGPEAVIPLDRLSEFGGSTTVNINVTSADPNAVVRALQQYVRQSGPVPLNTRTM